MQISTSSYSLHRTLGQPVHTGDPRRGQLINTNAARDGLDLLQLPAQLAAHNIHTLELCHFHLPSVEPAYLASLRHALDDAGVTLFSVLIDAGDIAQPTDDTRLADVQWTAAWLDIAATLGATHARISPGHTPPDDALITRLAAELASLARHARDRNVNVITENWHALSREPQALLKLLDACPEPLGLCVDFGNAEGPDKYDILTALLPHATSIHAKARYNDAAQLDRDELTHCLELARNANFTGPVSLIYTHDANEWPGLAEMHDVVAACT